jgi:4-amino-4-deoxy-L-arabinose transferase-like glycosyltransferase/membrane-associated phospholipid phosphatase
MNPPEIDTLIFFFINRSLQNRFFDVIMPFITGKAYLLMLLFAGWFFYKDRKKAIIASVLALASFAVSDWSSEILKHIFERQRPCNVLEGVHLLVGCSGSYSMPSNHAVNAFAFTMPFLILFRNKIKYALIIIALLVSFSRVYVGVHYPSDVIAGGFLGLAMAILVTGLYKKAYKRFKESPYSTLLFVFILIISLFRIYYIQNGALDLSPDEAHYWDWSRRLDLSYYSKGPMIAYLIYIGTAIFGDNVFGIRAMAVLFSALSSIFIYILGKKLYDRKTGLLSAILIQVIPLFSTFGIIFTIDSPFIFFWILSLLLFWKAIDIKDSGNRIQEAEVRISAPPTPPYRGGKAMEWMYWILLGLSIGFGLLTKYTMAFFYLCIFLFLLSKERRLLFAKGPYVAIIISLLVFSPVVLWNAEHDWVTLRHTAGQANIEEGFTITIMRFLEFTGSQFGVISPLLLVLMAISIWKLRRQREGAFLFWFSTPVIAFFILKSLQGKVQANWAMPGYITGIISFSAFYKNFYSEGRGKKLLITSAILLSVVLTSIAHYPSILNLPVKKDPTSRLRGWKELGEEVTKIYDEISVKRPVFIFSDRYQVSSELAFYVKGHPITYCIVHKRRMNQYDLWPGFQNLLHYDAIFVRIGNTRLPKEVEEAFEKIEKRLFTAYTSDKKIRDYSIFLCYDFNGMREEKPGSY